MTVVEANPGERKDQDEPNKNLFITTSDVLRIINGALDKLEANPEDRLRQPRFELQKRLPDGSTIKADAADMAVADMESKLSQAAKEIQDLSPSQRLEWAELQRVAGNKLFSQQEYKEAIDVYLTCLVVKSNCPHFSEKVFLPVMNNLAHCCLKMKWYSKAQTFCTIALEEDLHVTNRPDLISKLFYRRGKARRLSGDYTRSRQDFCKAARLLPQHHHAEHLSIKKELQLVQRGSVEAKRNQSKQQLAMNHFFDAPTYVSTGAMPLHRTSEPRLYDDCKKGYSTLRAAPTSAMKGAQRLVKSHQLSYWQYYIAVIRSIAIRLLIALGDEETIAREQDLLEKDA